MAKPSEFDDTFLADSYGRLLQVRFAELSLEQRKSILGWIRKGPNLEHFMPRWEKVRGVKPTAEEWEDFRKGWLRKRLKWIPAELLPAADMELLKQIEAEIGPEQSEAMCAGVEASSKTIDELRAMSAEEIAEFLKLNPPREGRGPTSRACAGSFQAVQERVTEFSSAARAYIGVHQSWIRACYGAWTTKSGREPKSIGNLSWLCVPGLSSSRGERTSGHRRQWRCELEGVRGVVADILRDGLQDAGAVIPAALGSPIWAILERLAEESGSDGRI